MPDVNSLPSPEEVEAILSDVSEPEELRILNTEEERSIASRIIPILAAKANAQAEANKAKELNKTVEEIKARNKEMIEVELGKLRDAAKPPDLKEIEKLLNQEYMEIAFKIRERNSSRVREFSIRELPQSAEERFIKILQKAVLPRLKEFAAIEWTNTNSTAERIQRVLEMFPEMLDTMAELATVSLDPFEEDKEIDKEWVRGNLGTFRITLVIQAQVEAGRFRDFFLAAFRAIPSQMMA